MLTPRQQDVLLLLARGLSNKAIASQLEISESTVKVHIRAIMERTRSEEHTSELQSLMRISYAVFCLKKKKQKTRKNKTATFTNTHIHTITKATPNYLTIQLMLSHT